MGILIHQLVEIHMDRYRILIHQLVEFCMNSYMIVDLPGSCVDRYGIPQIRCHGSSKSDVKFLDDTSRKKAITIMRLYNNDQIRCPIP